MGVDVVWSFCCFLFVFFIDRVVLKENIFFLLSCRGVGFLRSFYGNYGEKVRDGKIS